MQVFDFNNQYNKTENKILLLQIPFTKDCGAKNKCISDLALNVKASIAGDR